MKRLDTGEKVNSKAVFGIDVKMPKMLTAVVARPPIFGATMKSFDDSVPAPCPGVRKIVAVPSGVAVIADSSGKPKWREKHFISMGRQRNAQFQYQ